MEEEIRQTIDTRNAILGRLAALETEVADLKWDRRILARNIDFGLNRIQLLLGQAFPRDREAINEVNSYIDELKDLI